MGTSISTLNITLSRADLSSEYTCVVESDAVIDSIQSKIYPDVLGNSRVKQNRVLLITLL